MSSSVTMRTSAMLILLPPTKLVCFSQNFSSICRLIHDSLWLHQRSAHRAASAFGITRYKSQNEALLSHGGMTAKHCGRSLHYSSQAYLLPQWHP